MVGQSEYEKKPPNPEQIATKGFSMDFVSVRTHKKLTKNLGKSSFIWGIVSKMAAGWFKLPYLNYCSI